MTIDGDDLIGAEGGEGERNLAGARDAEHAVTLAQLKR